MTTSCVSPLGLFDIGCDLDVFNITEVLLESANNQTLWKTWTAALLDLGHQCIFQELLREKKF